MKRLRQPLRRVQRRFMERVSVVDPEKTWFWDHYDSAAGQIVEFLASGGVPLRGQQVADVGCGDGIMALGLMQRAQPARLVGFDLNPCDIDILLERAGRFGAPDTVPAGLEFQRSEPTSFPAENDEFDVVYTWSAFEHVGDPAGLMREIARVLKPDGVLMLQLWPFYYSPRGSHLWEWFPEAYHHLGSAPEEIVEAMRESGRHSEWFTEYMANEFLNLNRLTFDELHRSILAAGLEVRKLEAITEVAHVPPDARRFPLADLALSGVKLLAGHARTPITVVR